MNASKTFISIRQIAAEDTWPIRHRVMWPHQPPDFVKVPEDAQGQHWGLFFHHRLTSIISCFEHGQVMQFRKFATLPEAQGQGLGSRLLRHVLEDAQAKGLKQIWCNARLEKQAFYERFGLVPTAERFTKEGIAYVVMKKELV